ncbi:MAG: response regulator [Glaciimonas sp.]|nr:response regulator [Glaciimonas sp.]
MSGTLVLRIEVDVGTAMCFTIPITTTERKSVFPPTMAPVGTGITAPVLSSRQSVPTILIFDDHPINRLVIQLQLEALNCKVVLAENDDTALAVIAQRSFPLVLLDYCYMPGKDAYQVAREIRMSEAGSTRHIRIVAIAAAVDQAHMQSCLDAGMDGVLRKPLYIEDLRKLIEAWCYADLSSSPDAGSDSGSDQSKDPNPSMKALFLDIARQDFIKIKQVLTCDNRHAIAAHAYWLKGAMMMFAMGGVVVARTF